MRNFHLPLPDDTYTLLREQAKRAQVPATTLAREAIDDWLRQQARRLKREAITAYAKEMAGSAADLDAALEQAATDHLIESPKRRK